MEKRVRLTSLEELKCSVKQGLRPSNSPYKYQECHHVHYHPQKLQSLIRSHLKIESIQPIKQTDKITNAHWSKRSLEISI